MIKHVGYAVVDSEGDVFVQEYVIDSNDLEGSLQESIEIKGARDIVWPEFPPHNVVRLLIDDAAVNEQ